MLVNFLVGSLIQECVYSQIDVWDEFYSTPAIPIGEVGL